jgi:hypothetical protein
MVVAGAIIAQPQYAEKLLRFAGRCGFDCKLQYTSASRFRAIGDNDAGCGMQQFGEK